MDPIYGKFLLRPDIKFIVSGLLKFNAGYPAGYLTGKPVTRHQMLFGIQPVLNFSYPTLQQVIKPI